MVWKAAVIPVLLLLLASFIPSFSSTISVQGQQHLNSNPVSHGSSVKKCTASSPTYETKQPPIRVNVMPDHRVCLYGAYAYSGTPTVVWGNVKNAVLPANYTWDFGDGSPPASGNVTNIRFIAENHTYYTRPGQNVSVYRAVLTVTDSLGRTDSDEVFIRVVNASALTYSRKLAIDTNINIAEGLRWLYLTQDVNGSWSSWGFRVGTTAEAVLAFENQGHLPVHDPDRDIYAETVQAGLNFLFRHAYVQPISGYNYYCPYGDPDTNGNGIGIYFDTLNHTHPFPHSPSSRYEPPSYEEDPVCYETGMVLTAIVGSLAPFRVVHAPGSPIHGWTYIDVVQDAVDFLAWAQGDYPPGRGGWRYDPNWEEWPPYNYSLSDNSVTQWPTLGLMAAELWGVTIPRFVKPELSIWIDYIQNDTSGGSGYTAPDEWVNVAKTGALLIEMSFCGDNASTPRAVNAINYIDANWASDSEHLIPPWGSSWITSYYAMYAVMKGFTEMGVRLLPSGLDWYRTYAEYLNLTQNPDGSWGPGLWSDTPLATAWAILILSPTVFAPPIPHLDVWPDRRPYGNYTFCENVTLIAHFTKGLRPIDNATVTFQVVNPLNETWLILANQTDRNGFATVTFHIPRGLEPFGWYKVYATAYKPCVGNDTAETTFGIFILRPRIEVRWEKIGKWRGNITIAGIREVLKARIVNVGNGTARDLNVTLVTPTENFTLLSGLRSVYADLPPGREVTLWIVFIIEDDGYYTFNVSGTYYVSAFNVTESIVESLTALALWSFDFPAAIISWTLTQGATYFEFNVTIRNYLDGNVTVLIATSAIDEYRVPLPSDIEYVTLTGGEVKTVTLRVSATWELSGNYYWQIILLTDEPSNGGYALEYIDGTVTVT